MKDDPHACTRHLEDKHIWGPYKQKEAVELYNARERQLKENEELVNDLNTTTHSNGMVECEKNLLMKDELNASI